MVFVVGSVFGSDVADDIHVLVGVKGGEGFLLGVEVIEFGEAFVLHEGRSTMDWSLESMW